MVKKEPRDEEFLCLNYIVRMDTNDLAQLCKKFKVENYRSIDNNLDEQGKICFGLVLMNKCIKKVASPKNTLEDYEKVKNKDITDYHHLIISDLLHDRNTEMLKQLLPEEFLDIELARSNIERFKKGKEEEEDKTPEDVPQEQSVETDDPADVLKRNNRNQAKQIEKKDKQIEKLKEEIRQYRDRCRELEDEVSDLQNDLSEKVGIIEDLEAQKGILLNKIDELSNESREESKHAMYMEKLFAARKVLLLEIQPKEQNCFPYQYVCIRKDITQQWPEGKFNEVWVLNDMTDGLEWGFVLSQLKARYGNLDVMGLSGKQLIEFELEVVQ